MAEFWNLIVKSNTFNFIVLVAIFCVIFTRMNLPVLIENLRKSVASAIENAKLMRQNADLALKQAKYDADKVDSVVSERIESAKHDAKGLADNILKNANANAAKILDNAKATTETEEKKTVNFITKSTMLEAIKIAHEKILARLKDDATMHDKLIQKSIEELEKAEL